MAMTPALETMAEMIGVLARWLEGNTKEGKKATRWVMFFFATHGDTLTREEWPIRTPFGCLHENEELDRLLA